MVRALGYPVVIQDGVEADDVIGTLAHKAQAAGWRTVMATGDKDLTQLVNSEVLWFNTMSGDALDVAGVTAKFGIPPERMVDYLTLVGDSVDNVPGVEKVGPKTAVKWLTEFGTLDNIIEKSNEIKGKVGEYLRAAVESNWLPQARKLVTVVCVIWIYRRPYPIGKMCSTTLRTMPLYWRFINALGLRRGAKN